MTKLLLEKSATINAFDKKDRRAVHWAAYMGHVDVVKILVEHGAELNCRDKQVNNNNNEKIRANIVYYPSEQYYSYHSNKRVLSACASLTL